MELLIVLFALAVLPIVAHIVAQSQEALFRDLLSHLAETMRTGEPKEVMERRLQIEMEKVRLQQAMQREFTERKRLRETVDLTS